MVSGTYHDLLGLLTRSNGRLALVMPDGRRWDVSAHFSAEAYVGKDVRVVGFRGPDATLFVDRIEVAKNGRRDEP